MKKILIVLLVVIILLSVSSCAAEDMENTNSINDTLKISAWVFDESIEGNVYNEESTAYTLERLKLNEVRMIAPMGDLGIVNFSIYLDFAGTVEVVAEEKDIQLSQNSLRGS